MTWAVGTIVVPIAAACLSFLFGRYATIWIVAGAAGGILLAVGGLAGQVWEDGPLRYPVGGWEAPLGIDWYADGLTISMLLMSAVVVVLTSIYAWGYLRHEAGAIFSTSSRPSVTYETFWPLWFFLWAALNALFLSADLFNLYVTLELLGLSAAILMTLGGRPAALTAGMRYLLVSLLGSLAYLLGVGFLYGAFGTLDLESLQSVAISGPTTWVAITLITLGLLLKTGLFPLHIWLPPAHANAPAPVSAILSGLVVKASFYVLLRLWFQIFHPLLAPLAGHFLGVLGAGAILWGSLQAFRQERLKLLVAYSTVAQLGYLFLLFPLADMAAVAGIAWSGGIYHALSHALAKAAMFLAAGNIMLAVGHDRTRQLDGLAQSMPMTVFAFGLGGMSLMGLPPSGGFVAKWLLLRAALESGQWWWAGIILGGGLMAAGYIFMVLKRAFAIVPVNGSVQAIPYSLELIALTLALCAVLLGLATTIPLTLLQIGAPFPSELISGGR